MSSPDFPFFPGTGGTEAFTFGIIRELRRTGFDARIVTVDQSAADGRDQLPDIPFLDLPDQASLSGLDATLVAVVDPFTVPTRMPGFVFAHVPPDSSAYSADHYKKAAQAGHTIIANSEYSQRLWAEKLGLTARDVPVVYPFAHPAFAKVYRSPRPSGVARILFAGRLHIHKGIFLLLEALYHPQLQQGYSFTVTTARGHDRQGEEILRLIQAHPRIKLEKARTSPEEMASLMAEHDIVVVPSNHLFWQEAFGMVSIEAQHAGCRVVATDTGGLPETDVGGLSLFEPGNSLELANSIQRASRAGKVSEQVRRRAAQQFTVAQSVDSLLAVINGRS